MKIVDFGPGRAHTIELFDSVGATSVPLGSGAGEAHAYWIRIRPGGSIGRHTAGFDQLFLVVEGSGWVEGGDGRRIQLGTGQGAIFERGELHGKGSDEGLAAVMVQVDRFDPPIPG